MSINGTTITTTPARVGIIGPAFATVLLLALVTSGPARAGQSEVTALIDRVTGEFAAVQQDDGLSQQARVTRLATLFEGSFDVERISNLIIDPHATRPSENQMTEFRTLFSRYVAVLCAGWLSGTSSQSLVVTGQRHHSPQQSFVTAELRRPAPDQPIRVGFRISRTPDGLRIYDVLVQGMSLVLTKRDEIRSLVAREGMDRMLARLRTVTQLAETNNATASKR